MHDTHTVISDSTEQRDCIHQETQARQSHDARSTLQQLRAASRRLHDLSSASRTDGRAVESCAVWATAIDDLGVAIELAEAADFRRADIRYLLRTAQAILRRSPFVAHVQDWPRGYVGDFQAIEMLWSARSDVQDPVGKAIETVAFSSPLAHQHRHKLLWQADALTKAFSKGHARVVVLGCGGGIDVLLASRWPHAVPEQLLLVDRDRDALDLALSRLPPAFLPHCTVLQTDVIAATRRMQPAAGFDLIVAGGLFDYLSDRAVLFVLTQVVTRLLRPEGTFVFTNLRSPNPYRPWMEYLADWPVIARSRQNVEGLLNSVADAAQASLELDPTGLAWLISVTRSATATGRTEQAELKATISEV